MINKTPFKPALNGLLSYIQSRPDWADKSSMWQTLIRDFDRREETDPLDSLVQFRGYGLMRQRSNWRLLVQVISFRWLLLVAKVFRGVSNRLYGRLIGSPLLPIGLLALKKLGLYDDYQRFVQHFSLSEHSIHAQKLFYVSHRLAKYYQPASSDQKSLVEIGGGLGVLAAINLYRFKPSHYLIIDLPEMLVHSANTLHALYPHLPCYFLLPNQPVRFLVEQPGLYFCVPEMVDELPGNTFHAAMNVDSFQEMSEFQVQSYLSLCQRLLVPQGVFLNLNRRKYLSTEKFDNNPLCYAYEARNRVLVWELDAFMSETFNWHNIRRDG
jgi:hypothetical protein